MGSDKGGNESRIPGQQDWVCPICGIKVAAHDKEQRKACLRKMRDQRTDPGRNPASSDHG